MNIQQLRQRGTIVASLPLRSTPLDLGRALEPARPNEIRSRVYVDTDRDGALDFAPDGSQLTRSQEPILFEDFRALIDYSANNDSGTILTKSEVGELTTCTAYKRKEQNAVGEVYGARGPWGTLTDGLEQLNPLPKHPEASQLEWAIGIPGVADRVTGLMGTLYLVAPHSPAVQS